MANKREIKKYVDALGASLCESMMAAYYNVDGIDKAGVEKAIGDMLGAIGAAKSHANEFFGKGVKDFADKGEYLRARKDFYKQLFRSVTSEFTNEVNEALKVFNGAIPAEVKKQMKELAVG